MRSKDYWRKREEKAIRQRIEFDADNSKYIDDLLDSYMREIQREINSEWERYARKNNLPISEAMKKADKMDVEGFQRTAKRMVEQKGFSKTANDLLKTYNMKMRVSRLELLKARVALATTSMGMDLIKHFDARYTESVIRELERQAGIWGKTLDPDVDYRKQAEQIINGSHRVDSIMRYDGSYKKIFSQMIWGNVSALQAELDVIITKSMMQGRNPHVFKNELQRKFNTTKYETDRLIRTEMSKMIADTQIKSYKDSSVEYYEYVAEPGACKVCLPLNGKKFKVSKSVVGVNTAPLHPNCKCSTLPYFDEEEFEKSLRERGL